MPVLACRNISKTYIIDKILDGVSFTIEEGDKVGLIGLNGSGKTTLFNILAGEISKDSGDIFIQKDLKIGYLKQHTSISSQKQVFEECLEIFQDLISMEKKLRNLEEEMSQIGSSGQSEKLDKLMNRYGHLSEKFTALNGYGYKSDIRGVLVGLGFEVEDFSKKVDELSGGQKSRLALAKLLLEKPDLLLLDEPTNHLDIGAIDWLEKFLKDYEGAALIISHDRYFLDNTVNRIFNLENKKINIYNTNYTKFMEQRKKDLEVLQKQYENQQREIKRQEEIIQRFMNYGNARYIRQAQARQKLLEKIKQVERPVEAEQTRIKFEPKLKSGRDVLEVKELAKSFGDRKLFSQVNFQIYRGERVGLIGPNGVGKTTLFKLILNQLDGDEGEIRLGHHVSPAYFDQEMSSLNLNKTIIDEIWDDNPKLTHFEIRRILSQFLFVGDDIFKEISDLSGGERARLSLLKLMLSEANFLLMDEPTNHLDIDSKEVLEDALLDYQGTVFVISHDRYFLNRVSTRILELTETGVKEYLGNYDYYLEKKYESQYLEEESTTKTKTQIRLEKRKEREKLIKERKKRQEINGLEKEITKAENKLTKIDSSLSNPDIYDDLDKIVELNKKRERIENQLNQLYEKWMSLNE